MSDDRIKAATASWERYFDVHYPHSVDDLSPADYFLDWDRLFLGRGVDLVGERPPVVAIHARALIDKFTEGSNFRNSEPIQTADTREREALSVQYREVAEIRNNPRVRLTSS